MKKQILLVNANTQMALVFIFSLSLLISCKKNVVNEISKVKEAEPMSIQSEPGGCNTITPLAGNNFPNVGGTYTANYGGAPLNVTISHYPISYPTCDGGEHTITFSEALGWPAYGSVSVAPGFNGSIELGSNGTFVVVNGTYLGGLPVVNWSSYNTDFNTWFNDVTGSVAHPNLVNYFTASTGTSDGTIRTSGQLIRTNSGSGFGIVPTCYITKRPPGCMEVQ